MTGEIVVNPWVLTLVPFVASGFGAYFGSYLKKKGENLASKEDIDDLVEQVRAVTRATKEIETKISDEVWDRQKRWEMKRDVVFELVRRSGNVKDALTSIMGAYGANTDSVKRGGPGNLDGNIKAAREWNGAMASFEEASMLAELICGKELGQTLRAFSLLARELVVKVMQERHEEVNNELAGFVQRMGLMLAEVRKEIVADNPS